MHLTFLISNLAVKFTKTFAKFNRLHIPLPQLPRDLSYNIK